MTAVDILEHTELDIAPVHAAQVSISCASDPASISSVMQQAFSTLGPYMGRHRLVPAGPPRAIYSEFNEQETRFTLAMPCAIATGASAGHEDGVTIGVLPGLRAHRFTHRGPYSDLKTTYGAITGWMQKKGLMKEASDWMKYSPMWEEYVTDPRSTAPADLVTYIYLPVVA